MRDWSQIDTIYSELLTSVYPQPEDDGHLKGCKDFVDWLMRHTVGIQSVIDAGCGEGMAQTFLAPYGIDYYGFALGVDVVKARERGRNVYEMDFNFIPADVQPTTCFMARHALEHSPFPHVTLKHWRKFTTKYVALVMPAVEWYKPGTVGSNHFSVLNESQWEAVFTWAGLKVVAKYVKYKHGHPDHIALSPSEQTQEEYWYVLTK